MSILVTGGAGFIGSNFILNWFDCSDEQIINLDTLTYAGNLMNLESIKNNRSYVFIRENICNSDEFTILSSFPTERSFITESIYSGVNIQSFDNYKTNIPIIDFYNQFILLSRNNQLQKIYKCNITIGKLIDPTNFTDIVSIEQPDYNINTIYGISACIIVGICGLFVCASDIKSPPRNHGRRGSFSILPPDQESDNP